MKKTLTEVGVRAGAEHLARSRDAGGVVDGRQRAHAIGELVGEPVRGQVHRESHEPQQPATDTTHACGLGSLV